MAIKQGDIPECLILEPFRTTVLVQEVMVVSILNRITGRICIAALLDELTALERRQLHIEAVLLLQGLALIMPTHRKTAALQNHALELLNAVIQLRPGIPEILVELLVDLLQRHCVNNHSRSIACNCKDSEK